MDSATRDAVVKIWQRYHDRDHWQHYSACGIVTYQLRAYRQEHGEGNREAEQDIKDHWRDNARGFALHRHSVLAKAFAAGDINTLRPIVRYDQPLTLELCELITGRKLKGLSNKRLDPLLDELCREKEAAHRRSNVHPQTALLP